MSGKRDYYEVLGLSRDCTMNDIKQAYRKLARIYHPDVNNGDPQAEEKFKEISEAYAVLSNEEKRRQYDMYGFSGNLFDGINFESVFSEFGFGDLFNMFFGDTFGSRYSTSYSTRQGSTRKMFKGTDVYVEATISFKEAAFGVKKEIEYNVNENCPECKGKKAKSDSGIATCSVCRGTGKVSVSRSTFLGSLITTSTCQNCQGTGVIVKEPCEKCNGKGYIKVKRKISVDIPSGVNDNDSLRISGQGNSLGASSIPGDLILNIKVKPHLQLKRDGNDVVSIIDISFAQAALGTKLNIETLDGNEEIYIKPGTQPGSKIVLKSRGIVPLNGYKRGDHIVYLNVKIPSDLNEDEKALLKKYAEGRGELVFDGKIEQNHNNFFSNFKKVFKN